MIASLATHWRSFAAILAGLLVAARLWWSRRKRKQAEAGERAAELDAKVEHGRAEVATATLEVAHDVATRQAEGRTQAGEIEAAAVEAGPNPLDQIRAADRVRRVIAGRRGR